MQQSRRDAYVKPDLYVLGAAVALTATSEFGTGNNETDSGGQLKFNQNN